jgi:hypothetical protein
MLRFPNLLILPNKVYSLSIKKIDSKRASDRFLIDHAASGVNFLDPLDKWTTFLGVSREFYEDYVFYKLGIPLAWLLVRFIHNHVRSNSLDLLSRDDGQVLTSANFEELLGQEIADAEAEEQLRTLLISWARVHPKGVLEFRDIYVSTDFTVELVKRSLDALKLQGHVRALGQDVYAVEKEILEPVP